MGGRFIDRPASADVCVASHSEECQKHGGRMFWRYHLHRFKRNQAGAHTAWLQQGNHTGIVILVKPKPLPRQQKKSPRLTGAKVGRLVKL